MKLLYLSARWGRIAMQETEKARGTTEVATLPVGQRRELVARVAASRTFQKSARQRDIFLYLCERALADPHGAIREQDIGSAVFGRPADYDTGQDNLVRVHVSELRRRLEKFFEDEGAGEAGVVEIPKGSYVPVFHVRPKVETPDPAEIPVAQAPPIPAAPQPRRYLPYALCALLLLACGWLLVQNRRITHQLEALPASHPLPPLWTRLLVPGQQTDIVLADSNLSLLQDLTGDAVSLNQYLNRQYWQPSSALAWSPERKHEYEVLMARRYTSISDADFVRRVMSLQIPQGARVSVFFARDYALENLQNHNTVLVGSRRSNPWVELFTDRLSFQFEVVPATRIPRYRVRDPQPGEQSVYDLDSRQPDNDAYGAIAFLPNPSRTGNVLLISGTGIQAIRAGAEFVTSDDLLKSIGGGAEHLPPRYFELLYRTKRVGGAARDLELLVKRNRGE